MSKEFKHYALKSTRRPAASAELLTTVAVRDGQLKPFYCYASFSRKLVEYVGKKLTRGVSLDDPAYLLVRPSLSGGWEVWAVYVNPPHDSVLLWESDEQPSWIRFYKPKPKP